MNSKKISKLLSLVLRHEPEAINIELDNNGWGNVDEIIENMSITFDQLSEVVTNNNKQRFTFSDDKTKIRANQGHSINIDLELESAAPPLDLYHGTSEDKLDIILSEGISKMGRQHVHLSDNIEVAKQVGSRHGKVVVLKINVELMVLSGCTFYQSKNGVWLVDHVIASQLEVLDEV
jgi:putative RNA 2'-phosphotransferase